MDRDALQRFLTSPHRTLRWNDGHDYGRYEGVETSEEGLLWFHWAHATDDGVGGMHDTERQTYEAFVADGPARPIPTERLEELRALVGRILGE